MHDVAQVVALVGVDAADEHQHPCPPIGTDSTCPPWPSAVGGVKPGSSATGSTATGSPSSRTAGAQPDPSTTATSWRATPVRSAIALAAWVAACISGAVTVGEPSPGSRPGMQ
ncbi:Uncharacterised protein [Mycolicibacterium phlei]|nr:Uncharacterised protein [Mycolicibacterium phlei]